MGLVICELKRTTLSVDSRMLERIAKYGRYGESPNGVLHRLLDDYERLLDAVRRSADDGSKV